MDDIDDIGGIDDDFSMADLEKDLKKGRGGRRWLWFLIGLATGVGATVAAPRYLVPYLPESLRGEREILTGPVLGEERSEGRLLLTIDTEPGALIASFSERVDEIALLVDLGDVVTIAVSDYEPFVENPDLEGVRKSRNPADEDLPAETTGRDGTDEAPTDEEDIDAGQGEEAVPPDTTRSLEGR